MAFLLARYLIGDFVSSLLRGKSRKWDVVCLATLSFGRGSSSRPMLEVPGMSAIKTSGV